MAIILISFLLKCIQLYLISQVISTIVLVLSMYCKYGLRTVQTLGCKEERE